MDKTYTHPGATARLARPRDSPRRSQAPSDAALIAASRRDPDAFTRLFERHWDRLFRFCRNRVGAAGEDLAAETFRIAFDRRRRYDVQCHDARPWLFGIANNLIRDYFRSAQREESKRERSAALEPSSATHAEVGELERQLLGPHLADALSSLTAADRDALLLLAWADFDYEQIARTLEIPIGTVRSRIHRARHRVREYLDAGADHSAHAEETSHE
jgi:RNA polymerase sigma factor (sigma-70 family)